MIRPGELPLMTWDLAFGRREVACQVCGQVNASAAESCVRCRAPVALSLASAHQKQAPSLIAVLGPPESGKSVYLGMLMDQLARRPGSLHLFARGAFSVAIQQQCLQALENQQFPLSTRVDPEYWNWLHCDVAVTDGREQWEIILPDIAGRAMEEGDETNSRRLEVVQTIMRRCRAALLMIDTQAIERGDTKPDFFSMKTVKYLGEWSAQKGRRRADRPVALVFTKSALSDLCQADPEGYARAYTPGLWRQCQDSLKQYQFFASSVAGPCLTIRRGDSVRSFPLRIEPRNVVEPFEWLVRTMAKTK